LTDEGETPEEPSEEENEDCPLEWKTDDWCDCWCLLDDDWKAKEWEHACKDQDDTCDGELDYLKENEGEEPEPETVPDTTPLPEEPSEEDDENCPLEWKTDDWCDCGCLLDDDWKAKEWEHACKDQNDTCDGELDYLKEDTGEEPEPETVPAIPPPPTNNTDTNPPLAGEPINPPPLADEPVSSPPPADGPTETPEEEPEEGCDTPSFLPPE
jgi:hypothetical protein